MKPASARRRAIKIAVEVAVILALHSVLIRVMAGSDVVATILSAGPHAPPGCLAAAFFFMLVRMLAVLALPGLVLYQLAILLLERRRPGGGGPAEG